MSWAKFCPSALQDVVKFYVWLLCITAACKSSPETKFLKAAILVERKLFMIVFLEETAPTNAELLAVKVSQRSVSGTEQEYSFSKAKVKHDRVWSPNGWVTILC